MFMFTDQFVVSFTIVATACIYLKIKFDQHFRIVKRSYFDEIETIALRADALVAEMHRQLALQHSGHIVKETVGTNTAQLSFNLPNSNTRTFKYYFEQVDPSTGERYGRIFTGKRADWDEWLSGKKFIYRRGKEMWVDEADVTPRDMIAVLRKRWDRKSQAWYYEDAWIYPDQRVPTDMDTGPFDIQEVASVV